MSFASANVKEKAHAPSTFNATELLNKLRSSSTSKPTTSPGKVASSSGSVASAATGVGAGSVKSSASVPPTSGSGESEDVFEIRMLHFKEMQALNAEMAKLRSENKKLTTENQAIRKQMTEQKAKSDDLVSQVRFESSRSLPHVLLSAVKSTTKSPNTYLRIVLNTFSSILRSCAPSSPRLRK